MAAELNRGALDALGVVLGRVREHLDQPGPDGERRELSADHVLDLVEQHIAEMGGLVAPAFWSDSAGMVNARLRRRVIWAEAVEAGRAEYRAENAHHFARAAAYVDRLAVDVVADLEAVRVEAAKQGAICARDHRIIGAECRDTEEGRERLDAAGRIAYLVREFVETCDAFTTAHGLRDEINANDAESVIDEFERAYFETLEAERGGVK